MEKKYMCVWVAAMLTACTGTDTFLPEKDGEADVPLEIKSLNLSVETKAIIDGVNSGSTDNAANHLKTIGVLVTKTDKEGATVFYTPSLTQVFTTDGSTWTSDKALNLSDADGTLYGWAPSELKAELSGDNPAKARIKSVKILAEQQVKAGKNEWDTDQDDLLYASAAQTAGDVTHPTVNKSNAAVDNLYMQHALSKISFKIMKADGQTVSDDDYVKQIVLGSTGSAFLSADGNTESAVMNLADGSLGGLTGTASLSLKLTEQAKASTYASDYSGITFPQAYGLVAPATVGDVSLKLTMGPSGELNETTDRTYQTKVSGNIQDVTWEKGKHYVYRITVSDQGVEVTNVKVVGWTDAGNTDVPVE